MSIEDRLFLAIRNEDYVSVAELVQDGADLNSLYKKETNCLRNIVCATFSHKTSQMLQYMIDNGVDIHYVFPDGDDLLKYAICHHAKIPILKCLLRNHADPNKKVHSLFLALRCNWDYIFPLVQAGANVDFIDQSGFSLLQWSVYYSLYTLKILIAAGADMDVTIDAHDEMFSQDPQFNDFLKIASYLFAANASLSYFSKATNLFTPLDTVIYRLTNENEKFRDKSALFIREYLEANGMIAKARKEIQKIKYQLIKERAIQVCIAMQDLQFDANRMCYIVIEACAPFTNGLDFHHVWNLVVKIKHFKLV